MPVTNPDKKMYKQLNILESVTHKVTPTFYAEKL